MKKAYKAPKVVMIDFTYDEQVTATSTPGGNVANWGDPDRTGYCQQSSETSCRYFWIGGTDWCTSAPFSLRPIV